MIDLLLAALSSSYLTLAFADFPAAKGLCITYAAAVLVLTILSIWGDRRARRARYARRTRSR